MAPLNKKILSTFSLIMINVIAVDNLRSLPISATFGFSLVFFYLVAACLFFLPSILLTAELATTWPEKGGVYIWIREAFGPEWGFFSISLQWLYNVVWYPTIFSFIAAVLAYLINPSLVNNAYYMVTVVLTAYWLMTWINLKGIHLANVVNTIGAIIGTILPMLLLIIFASIWFFKHHEIALTNFNFLPSTTNLNNIAFLTSILFGLMGIEMSAVHAHEVKNPARDYPRALIISGAIILVTIIFASLAIAMVVPLEKLQLTAGLMDAFTIFFNFYHLGWCIKLLACMIILGSLSGAGAWILGPARALAIACEEQKLPAFFSKLNQAEMPLGILWLQGVAVTLLCLSFLLLPSVNNAYWILSNLASQLGLIYYMLFFATGIKLRYQSNPKKRIFMIPGGKFGIWLVAGIGFLTCGVTILAGFIPPPALQSTQVFDYELILLSGISMSFLPLLLIKYLGKSR